MSNELNKMIKEGQGHIQAKVDITPKQLDLLQKHKNQHDFTVHLEQQMGALLKEKSLRVFQKNVVEQSGDQLLDVSWHINDMIFHYEKKYDKLVKILTEAIDRTDFKIKPLKARHRQSSEHEKRIMNEFTAIQSLTEVKDETKVGKKA